MAFYERRDRNIRGDAGANFEYYFEIWTNVLDNVTLFLVEFYADDCTGMKLPGIPLGLRSSSGDNVTYTRF